MTRTEWPWAGHGVSTLVRCAAPGEFMRLLVHGPAGWPPMGADDMRLHALFDHLTAHGLSFDSTNGDRLAARLIAYQHGNDQIQ